MGSEYGKFIAMLSLYNSAAAMSNDGKWVNAKVVYNNVASGFKFLREELTLRTRSVRAIAVRPVRCEDLIVTDAVLGTSDPYMIFAYNGTKFETRDIKRTIRPVFDKDCDEFVFQFDPSQSSILTIHLYDRDAGIEENNEKENSQNDIVEDDDDDPMGSISLDLKETIEAFGNVAESYESSEHSYTINLPEEYRGNRVNAGSIVLRFKLIDIFPQLTVIQNRIAKNIDILSQWLSQIVSKPSGSPGRKQVLRSHKVKSLNERIASVDGNRSRIQNLSVGDPANVQELFFVLA